MAGRFDCLLVYHSSRFAGNTIEAKRYKKLLRSELGIAVVSVTQPLGGDDLYELGDLDLSEYLAHRDDTWQQSAGPHRARTAVVASGTAQRQVPANRLFLGMERAGLEPATSGLQSPLRNCGPRRDGAGITSDSRRFVGRLAGIAGSRFQPRTTACVRCFRAYGPAIGTIASAKAA
jgi:hypothetical protein